MYPLYSRPTGNLNMFGGDQDKTTWGMSICRACENASVWRGKDLIYPQKAPGRAPSDDMPEAARELYEEARAVATASRRAGAALARASLECLLKELDPEAPKKSNLDDRIDRIRDKVSTATFKMLTLARHVGNKSLHVDNVPDNAVLLLLSDDDEMFLDDVFESINMVVDEMITKPNIIDNRYEQLPPGVRDNAEKSTGSTS